MCGGWDVVCLCVVRIGKMVVADLRRGWGGRKEGGRKERGGWWEVGGEEVAYCRCTSGKSCFDSELDSCSQNSSATVFLN